MSPSSPAVVETHASHAHVDTVVAQVEARVHRHTVYALDSLEKHKHLHLAYSAVHIRIAGHHCVPHVLVVLRGAESHPQAQLAVRVEELVALQLARKVVVVLLVDKVDVVFEHLVVDVGVPSARIVYEVVTVHSLVVEAGVSPPIEATTHASAHISSHSPIESEASIEALINKMLPWFHMLFNQYIKLYTIEPLAILRAYENDGVNQKP